jgi:Fe-S cluster assembly protein SufD
MSAGSSGWIETPSPSGEPEWLASLRDSAMARLQVQGLPSNKDEEWRFSPLGLFRDPAILFRSAPPSVPQLTGPAPPSVRVRRFSQMGSDHLLRSHLGRLQAADHAFAWLNTALFRDGLFVHVRSSPAVVDMRDGAGASDAASYQRSLIIVDPGCSATLIERHDGRGAPVFNGALELVIGEDAVVEHVRIQSDAAVHLGSVAVEQGRGSKYGSRVFALGGPYARLDLTVALGGEGASCELDGLFALAGREHADMYTLVDHQTPRCSSLERYRGLLGDQARGVFDGTILVRKGAVGTNARQESRNLLLSNQSIVNTKPHLEIDADDVKCGHGATVGHLDEQQLFYLTARGIARDTARAMLAFGFVQQILQRTVASPDDKRALREAVIARIPGGARLEEAP